MVLVTASWRRRGLATRLLDACLATAKHHGITPGSTRRRPVRRCMVRWDSSRQFNCSGCGLKARRRRTSAATAVNPRLQRFVTRDRRTMGFDRSTLLAELSGRPGSRLMSRDDAVALVRDGRNNRHIGPLFADGPDSALVLVDEIIRSETGPWLIDAVSTQKEFLRPDRLGLDHRAAVQRMRFGAAPRCLNTAARRRRPGIWIGMSPCIIAR